MFQGVHLLYFTNGQGMHLDRPLFLAHVPPLYLNLKLGSRFADLGDCVIILLCASTSQKNICSGTNLFTASITSAPHNKSSCSTWLGSNVSYLRF